MVSSLNVCFNYCIVETTTALVLLLKCNTITYNLSTKEHEERDITARQQLLFVRRRGPTKAAAITRPCLFLFPPQLFCFANHEKEKPVVVCGSQQDLDEEPVHVS